MPIHTPEGALVTEDGCNRSGTSTEALANLKRAFRADGVVSAGTPSPLPDGAVAVRFAERHGLAATATAAALVQREGQRYALATQCVGGGQGIATILERL